VAQESRATAKSSSAKKVKKKEERKGASDKASCYRFYSCGKSKGGLSDWMGGTSFKRASREKGRPGSSIGRVGKEGVLRAGNNYAAEPHLRADTVGDGENN